MVVPSVCLSRPPARVAILMPAGVSQLHPVRLSSKSRKISLGVLASLRLRRKVSVARLRCDLMALARSNPLFLRFLESAETALNRRSVGAARFRQFGLPEEPPVQIDSARLLRKGRLPLSLPSACLRRPCACVAILRPGCVSQLHPVRLSSESRNLEKSLWEF